MPLNPAYYVLKQDGRLRSKFSAIPKTTSEEKEHYYLLPLRARTHDLAFEGTPYRLTEHHLSIYAEFSDNRALHYTGTFTHHDQQLIVHVYFDAERNYLYTNTKLNTEVKPKVCSDPLLEQAMVDLANTCGYEIMSDIFVKISTEKSTSANAVAQALADLEVKSQNLQSQSYHSSLMNAIRLIDIDLQLDFHPNDSVKNILLGFKQDIEAKQQEPSKKSKKKKKKAKQTPEIITSEEKQVVTANPEPVADKKTEQQPVAYYHEYEREMKHLSEQLAICSTNDVNKMMKLILQMNNLRDKRHEMLIQACIDGNKTILEKYLNGNDVIFINGLVATCVYHNQPELYEYLNKKVKIKVMFAPYTSASLEYDLRSILSTHLHTAIAINNHSFFVDLIKKYQHSPNECYRFEEKQKNIFSLLALTASDQEYIEYTRTLLEAKADPNLLPEQNRQHVYSRHKEYLNFDTDRKIDIKKIKSSMQNVTLDIGDKFPLQVAVRFNNIEAVKLLLEHKADISMKEPSGFSAFGAITCINTDKLLNIRLMKTFLDNGQNIDERQGKEQMTALYYACQNGKLHDVRILLSLNADPFAEHLKQVFQPDAKAAYFDQRPAYIKMTPFTIAIFKNHIQVVQEILKKPISRKNIEETVAIISHFSDRISNEMQEILLSGLNARGLQLAYSSPNE